MAGEKAWRQLHKNAANNVEQFLETTLIKAAVLHSPTTHHKKVSKFNKPDMQYIAGEVGKSSYVMYSYGLLHRPRKIRMSAQTYIQQLCEDTGFSPGDLPESMTGRGDKRGSGISVLGAWQDDDDY